MRRLAAKRDRMPLHPECSQHRAERQVQVEQHRSLLDVQLEIGRRILEFPAALLHALEINADLLQRVRQPATLPVL